MRWLNRTFEWIHALMALLFAVGALVLMAMASHAGWHAATGEWSRDGAQELIEAIGLLAAAVVALQISQTVVEEEVVRSADISAPTRVRRFLSRFFVVILVALPVEGLVAVFKAVHQDLAKMVYPAALVAATGVLLAAWGLFVRLNRSAEELEPDAMRVAQQEDEKVG